MVLAAVAAAAAVLTALVATSAAQDPAATSRPGCGLESVAVDINSNLYRKCLRNDNRVGLCLNDFQCWDNGTISCGIQLAEDDIRIDDNPMPESECGDFLWCCYADTSASGVTVPGSETTTKSGSETTTKSGSETTTKSGSETTTKSGSETTTKSGPETTTKSGSETTTKSGSETTTKSGSETTTKSGSGSGTSQCLLYYDGGECPWCVALFRPGGDLARGHRLETGLYCAGAMVSPRAVLTSATCVRTVAEEAIWARVPGSADPARRYAVVEKTMHPKYNTGTHENDFGLLVLKEAVQWAEGPAIACMGRNTPLSGNCFVVGFDESEAITMTPVVVSDGDCPRKRPRKLADAACASSTDATCRVVPGAALLCPSISDGQGGLEIAGVARKNCIAGKALLGKLQPHADWLQAQLRRLE